jgi:hypothetical protein
MAVVFCCYFFMIFTSAALVIDICIQNNFCIYCFIVLFNEKEAFATGLYKSLEDLNMGNLSSYQEHLLKGQCYQNRITLTSQLLRMCEPAR